MPRAGKNEWDRKEHLDYYGQGSAWGLLVYHVRNDKNSWIGNSVNVTAGNEHYTILYSNPDSRGGFSPQYLPDHCFFPGGKNVTSLYSDGNSGFVSADGRKTMVEIPSIRLDETSGSVKLSVTERWKHHRPQVRGLPARHPSELEGRPLLKLDCRMVPGGKRDRNGDSLRTDNPRGAYSFIEGWSGISHHRHRRQEQQDIPDPQDREIRLRVPEDPTLKGESDIGGESPHDAG